MKVILVLCLLTMCGFSLLMVNAVEKTAEAKYNRDVEIVKLDPPSEVDHSYDTNQGIAEAGYKSVVAVAVSADASQTSIARYNMITVVSVVIGIMCLIGFKIYLDNKKQREKEGW
jgi:hypothetical protein